MLTFYNTLTKEKEIFKPLNGNKVSFFVCGPTVYDYPHLGHAKTYTQFDFIVKYLRYKGYNVYYLQNITDIDDKIIDRANQLGIDWKELSEKFENIYKEDMKSLGNDSINEYARATDHMPQIINQIKTLLDKGYAYKVDDGVYYEVSKFDEYGKLSGRLELKEEDSISRIDESSFKRGWNDFCLWKAQKPNEPFWESEIGPGRPGWHIEDTAITESHFGSQYDIHGGAIDLIFPHHECEIAQMEAASGKKPLVKYWLHTGFLNIDTQKMSKSKGNFTTVREILKEYDYRIIRYFILSSHYRATIDFGIDGLMHAKNALARINNFIFNSNEEIDDIENLETIKDVRTKIIKSLDNDFNTSDALSHLFTFIRTQNSKAINGKHIIAFFEELNQIFGNVFQTTKAKIAEEEIYPLIELREFYRKSKEFQKADRIRNELKEKGIELYDSKDGVQWRKLE
jgi:cysteinyl-tRNA synthetase